MRVASGVDVIDMTQIAQTLQNPAQLQRMLHPGDVTRTDPEHYAGRIALKEAVMKAIGLLPGSWLEIHIATAKNGKPLVTVTNSPPNLLSLDGSIAHHGGTVIAFAVALFDDKDE